MNDILKNGNNKGEDNPLSWLLFFDDSVYTLNPRWFNFNAVK